MDGLWFLAGLSQLFTSLEQGIYMSEGVRTNNMYAFKWLMKEQYIMLYNHSRIHHCN